MINYNDKYNEALNPELSESEQKILEKLESITDNTIISQFHFHHNMNIFSEEINKIEDKLGFYRSKVVFDKWKTNYAENGWDLARIHDERESYWIISKK
jgi:hypothetical protein